MLKRGLFAIILISLFVSISFVGAFSLKDWFNDFFKTTGHNTWTESQPGAVTCTDSDNGPDLTVKGTTETFDSNGTRLAIYEDWCFNAGAEIAEYVCSGTSVTGTTYSCPSGVTCSSGACTGPPPIQNQTEGSTATNITCEGSNSSYGVGLTASGTTKIYDSENKVAIFVDFCISSLEVKKYFCNGNSLGSNIYPCPTGLTCSDGLCRGTISSSGGGGGGGGGTAGTNTSTTSSNASSGGTGNTTSTTNGSSGGSGVVSQTNFSVNPQESTVTGSNGIIAVSNVQISTAEGKAYAIKEDGSKQEIKIDPTTAINSVKESIKSEDIVEVRIIEYKDRIVYEVDARKPVKIIVLIPANMAVRAKVDIEEGEIVSIEKPWWSFLAKET